MYLNNIQEIIREAYKKKASDVHIVTGSPIIFRIDGELHSKDQKILLPKEIEEIVRPIMESKELKEYEEKGEVDFAYSVKGVCRCRVNVFKQRGTLAATLRLVSFDVPNAKDLGLPKIITGLCNKRRGLVLVTGATGSGKSTTLAAILNIISETSRKNIITFEEPIEYLHKHKKSIVIQREIGTDTQTFANGLRAGLREDPDVIFIGEMRDLETISIALTAAETGHLVFSTLHTNNAADSINRIIDVFPTHQQPQIRVQLASVIECIVSQQLLPRFNKKGRVAAFEVMVSNPAVKNLIREEKIFQIPSVIQTGKKSGMQTMDDCLYSLYKQDEISVEVLLESVHDVEAMKKKLGGSI